ncbi:uncharacterized protein LOC125228371 [Leguminivora glycinivorella]|uniref:uncharacterized protein LOC125228371 n=1 Tax=Leguminivora glycinivorella TaxID=1035111 RepID=UPI00200F753D|nr:uncharacterized protein LOC125228371 [Leguminivora glycinivorella]
MDLQDKMTILNHIQENKNILFGKFSDKLTHAIKINKWKEITQNLNDLGIMEKDWKYLRDTMWQNWKRRTMEKRDNRFKTGSGGGKKMKYDASDDLIITIIGKESPVINGIDCAESSGSSAPQSAELFSVETECNLEKDVAQSPKVLPTPIKKKLASTRSSEGEKISNEILQLKKRKLELEIAKLERENYKLDLELMKLEKELNVTRPSKFTLPLYMQDDNIIQINLVNEPSETMTESTESIVTSE